MGVGRGGGGVVLQSCYIDDISMNRSASSEEVSKYMRPYNGFIL